MILAKNSLLDGQISFEKGEETHKSPSRVPRNQSTLLVNATTRQDYISQRPGWKQRAWQFSSEAVGYAFQNGRLQGIAAYTPDSGNPFMVASVSGHLYKITLDGKVEEIALAYYNSSNRKQAWFCQAECFLIIQDGQSAPIIYDGVSARRSNVTGAGLPEIDGHPQLEVPVGTCMEYSQGRLWVTLPSRIAYVASDLVYSQDTGTAHYSYRDSILRFTENTFLAGGGAFAVPAHVGKITAMKAIANLDTSLGQGPLQVFCTGGCFSASADPVVTAWAVVRDPVQTVSLIDDGALAHDSTVIVNSDIWYRAHDGIRSFIIARRDFGTWGNHAQSHEVGRHLERDNMALLGYGSAVLFDNRLLMTCQPQHDRDHGVYHKGLVALDFHPLTSILQSETPTWDGLWTGPDLMKLVTFEAQGVPRCFAIALSPVDADAHRYLQIWELSTSLQWDYDASDTRARITTVIESPRFDFGNKLEQKLLDGADIWVDKVSGDVDFYLYFRPDQYPCWFAWKHWSICAKYQRCASEAVTACLTGLNLKPQYRTRMSALKPPDACVEFTGLPSRLGYEFAYRMEIVGCAELTAVRLSATKVVEPQFGSCLPTDAACEEVICCAPEDVGNSQSVPDAPEEWNDDYYYYYDSYGGYGSTPVTPSTPTDNGGATFTEDGNGGSTTGTGDGTIETPPNTTSYEGIPIAGDWMADWESNIPSGYAVPKTSSDPSEDITPAMANFWRTLIGNEWDLTPPPVWSQRILAWDWVDSNVTNVSSLQAKFDASNPIPGVGDGEEFIQPESFWRLTWLFRT